VQLQQSELAPASQATCWHPAQQVERQAAPGAQTAHPAFPATQVQVPSPGASHEAVKPASS
jgi:hypothetical protein